MRTHKHEHYMRAVLHTQIYGYAYHLQNHFGGVGVSPIP